MYVDPVTDISTVKCVCKSWKHLLEDTVEEQLCEYSFKKNYSGIALMMQVMSARDQLYLFPRLAPDWKNSWKELYKRRITYKTEYVEHNLNRKLQKDLEFVFRPIGILAMAGSIPCLLLLDINVQNHTMLKSMTDIINSVTLTLN